MATISILIADPDAKLLDHCAMELMARGIYADGVSSADAVLTAYHENRYQLLLLDWEIAQGGLVETIRSDDPNQDIVILLGHNQSRDSQWSLKYSILDFVVKPFEVDELVVFIDRLEERQMLYDSQSRLLGENIEYAEMQQTYQAALEMIDSLDGEVLAERFIRALGNICQAKGVALWMPTEMGNDFHLKRVEGNLEQLTIETSLSSEKLVQSKNLFRGEPLLTDGGPTEGSNQLHHGETLLAPLARNGELFALAQCFLPKKDRFNQRDLMHASILSDFGTTALLHSRQYYQARTSGSVGSFGVLDQMLLFMEELEREREKSRRYHRSFGLLELPLERLFRALENEGNVADFKTGLQAAVRDSLREFDVLCWDESLSLFCLLPESSFLNCLTLGERAMRASLDFLEERKLSKYAPAICFGPASYPGDGKEFEQLFAACRRRAKQMLQSPISTSDLMAGDPWAIIEVLIGADSETDDSDISFGSDKSRWWGAAYQDVFSQSFVESVQAELVLEAQRQRSMPGYFFLGQPGKALEHGVVQGLRKIAGGRLRSYLLGSQSPRDLLEFDNMDELSPDPNSTQGYEVAILLTDSTTYGFFGRSQDGDGYKGFHTADWTIVGAMVDMLHRTYRLQTGVV